MRYYALFFIFVSIAALAPPLASQGSEQATAGEKPLSLFEFLCGQGDSIPVIQLDTDWGQLVRNKMKEEYQPGVLRFRHKDGSLATLDVKVRARGNIRKQVCHYPPIKIKAKKSQLKALGFQPANDLKMVLPCSNGRLFYDCVVREALIYHLYEVVYPVHFRAKLVNVESLKDEKERSAFPALFVEDEEACAARLGARVIQDGVIRPSSLEREAYLKMCFFQYMIANTDWSVPNRHNLETLAIPGSDRLVPVPYDFDYAGFTGTNYAVPYHALPIENVNQRFFLGNKVTEAEALETAKFFLDRKEELLRRCATFWLLDEREAVSAQKYLNTFFDLLENEKKVVRTFANAD
ncbi:MAG: hypothetical protein KDD10_01675 [Phaeodactylibacter sp.]|nr:hypothetical protein [Phaeodactylibacter sp.]MCB9295757.1 hypothetical protein [Lewinellaceae bacterium]